MLFYHSFGEVMGKIISIVNQKGGVGKTTTAINLAASLTHYEKNVLLIDLDPQCNASTGVGYEFNEDNLTIYDVLIEDKVSDAVRQVENYKNFSYIPSDSELVGLELEFADDSKRIFLLKEKLDEVKKVYDYILIDCPPSLNTLTLNALIASNSVIIPLQTEFYAMEGLISLSSTLKLVQQSLNTTLKVEGILFTMFDSRTTLSRQVVKNVVNEAPFPIFNTLIPRNVSLSEAPSHGESIITYSKSSKGARAYIKLAKELINGEIYGKK